jgi:transcriptional regulator with XRE-family HTH domain
MRKQTIRDEISFGQLVGSYRTLRANISQNALASFVGISEVALRKWEMDQSKPEAKNLQKLLEVFLELDIFTARKEEEEARALWKASRVNVVFDEVWTNALTNTRKLRPQKKGQIDAALTQPSEKVGPAEVDLDDQRAEPSDQTLLGKSSTQSETDQDTSMNEERRNLTQQGIALVRAGMLVPMIGHEAFIADVERALRSPSSGPGDKELKYLEQKIRYYWHGRWNAIIAPADLLSHLVAYVQEVKPLLGHSLLPSIRRRLCACLSEGMLLMGISFYGLGQFQTARMYYQTAVESAYEANNNILQASAWRYDSFSWIDSHETNRHKHAQDSMLKASHLASLESDLAVQCWVLAGLAEVHASCNEKATCLQALRGAMGLGQYGHGDRYYIHQFDPACLNGYQGICLQQFYRPSAPDTYPLLAEAKQALEVALAQPNIAPLQRAFYVTNMAHVRAREGEVESACDHAKQIIDIADTDIPLLQRLLAVRTHLEPYADVAAVKDLDRDIRELLPEK